MEGKMNLQDTFLNEARKENVPVSIFLLSENRSQLIYKHAISTIQRI